MFTRCSKYCAALAAFALVGCSTYKDIRDWWAEDSQGPTEQEWVEYRALYGDESDAALNSATVADSPPVARPTDSTPREPSRRIQQSTLAPPAMIAPPAFPPPSERKAPPKSRPAVAALAPSLVPPMEAPPVAETTVITEVPILPPSLVSVAGMSETRLRDALGAPTTAAERGARKIWRYAGNGCSVEVIFFLDVTRNTYAALEHRTLAPDSSVSSSPCLRSADLASPGG